MSPDHHGTAPTGGMSMGSAYSPRFLGELQSALAALADLDCAFESDIETVQASGIPEALKQTAVQGLQAQHQQRRARYVRQLTLLQEQITAVLPGSVTSGSHSNASRGA